MSVWDMICCLSPIIPGLYASKLFWFYRQPHCTWKIIYTCVYIFVSSFVKYVKSEHIIMWKVQQCRHKVGSGQVVDAQKCLPITLEKEQFYLPVFNLYLQLFGTLCTDTIQMMTHTYEQPLPSVWILSLQSIAKTSF